MSNNKHKKNRMMRRACGAIVPVSLLAVPAVQAQQDPGSAAPEGEPIQMEKMIVTGSRLHSAEAEGALSVTQVSVTDPVNVGFPRIADVLRTKTTQYGGVGIINEGYGNGGNGASTIALRGLPSNATLVLIDGRRTSSSDLNLIPEAAIERIEILNDGAGAIYGSDAVAGVVNIILKKDFSGVEVGAYYGNTTDTDISERKFTAVTGGSTEKGKFVVSVEYSASNDQYATDRERSAPSGDQVSGTSNPGTFTPRVTSPEGGRYTALRWSLVPGNTRGLTNAVQVPAGFNPYAYIDTTGLSTAAANAARNAEEARLNALLPADSPVRYGTSPSLLAGTNPGFPYGLYTPSYRPHEKYSAYFSGEHKIFDEHLRFFVNGYYVRNLSQNQLAPSPLAGRTVGTDNYWLDTVFAGVAQSTNLTGVAVSYRPVELGPRVYKDDFETFHGVAGLKGAFADSKYDWELGFMWDRVTQDTRISGGVKADLYDELLASSDPSAWNPFGYTPIGSSTLVNSAATLDSIRGGAMQQWEYTTMQVDFSLNGQLLELPGGTLEAAVGFDARKEKMDDQPDFAIQNGLVFPFNVAQPLTAQRDVGSLFAEVRVPITGPDMEIPVFHSFDVGLAVRHEEYSDVGATGVKPRVNFRWQPIEKQLTIHGSYAQGFIAPGFYDLYQLPGQDFQELYNPLTGIKTQAEDAVYTIGNSELKPSEAETYLIGFKYSPSFLDGFSIGANYYNITQTGIPFESAQYVVNQWWANGGPDNPSNPFGPSAVAGPGNPLGSQVELTPAGDIYQVRNVGPINTGERFTDGIDLILAYELETDIGTFTFTGQATRMLNFEQEDYPGAGTVDYLGRFWASGAALDETGFPEWRANVTLEYEYKDVTAAIAWNFMQGYEEDTTASNYLPGDMDLRDVRDYNTIDLRLGYKIPGVDLDVLVGCNNVFDEQPPMVLSSFESNVDRSNVDLRGRMWFINVSKTF